MEIKVRVFINDILIKPSELQNISIKNPSVDRIINEIVERNK